MPPLPLPLRWMGIPNLGSICARRGLTQLWCHFNLVPSESSASKSSANGTVIMSESGAPHPLTQLHRRSTEYVHIERFVNHMYLVRPIHKKRERCYSESEWLNCVCEKVSEGSTSALSQHRSSQQHQQQQIFPSQGIAPLTSTQEDSTQSARIECFVRHMYLKICNMYKKNFYANKCDKKRWNACRVMSVS